MKRLDAVIPWLVCSQVVDLAQPAEAKTYFVRGRAITLPDNASVIGDPAMSPDGRQVAYMRSAGLPANPDGPQPTEVVLTDLSTGGARVLVHSGVGSEWYGRPVIGVTYAVDNRHLYAERAFPGTSSSIYEIDLATGAERLIGWGIDVSVLRDGPWRGDLLMGVHTCYRSHPGCDYPIHLVTPAGKSVYVVPGTAGADRVTQLQGWLAKRGWQAW